MCALERPLSPHVAHLYCLPDFSIKCPLGSGINCSTCGLGRRGLRTRATSGKSFTERSFMTSAINQADCLTKLKLRLS
eukprot:6125138-Pyramimonas_sp.AAC.1